MCVSSSQLVGINKWMYLKSMGVLIHLCLIYLTTICDHYPQYTSHTKLEHNLKEIYQKKEKNNVNIFLN